MLNSPLVVICGPTGTGKTDLAIKLCQQFNGEIISADSRQVYRKADIGTNKTFPPHQANIRRTALYVAGDTWVQDGIKIHLYNVVKPKETFSVTQFINAASKVLKSIVANDKIPFLVGGTGFYIHTLLGERTYSRVRPDWKLRERLSKLSVDQLISRLEKLDKEALKQMNNSDRKNRRRLVRYIELANSAGTVRKGIMNHKLGVRKEQVCKIGLTATREFLYQKADRWVTNIINHGLIEETQELISQYGEEIPLLQGLIYAPTVTFIKGQIGKDELLQKIQLQIHHYIRRQLVWFKRDKEIRWYNIEESGFEEKVSDYLKKGLKNQ